MSRLISKETTSFIHRFNEFRIIHTCLGEFVRSTGETEASFIRALILDLSFPPDDDPDRHSREIVTYLQLLRKEGRLERVLLSNARDGTTNTHDWVGENMAAHSRHALRDELYGRKVRVDLAKIVVYQSIGHGWRQRTRGMNVECS